MRSQTTNVTNYVLRNQLGVRSSCDKWSKHNFASPLKMTALHLSWIASCIAHRIALAFACDGEQRWCSLPQREKATPKWFLATVAKADLVLLRVALTLILIQPWEGGWWGGGGGGGVQISEDGSNEGQMLGEYTFEASRNLVRTLLMALDKSTLSPWKRRWFLVFQISSMIKAMFSGIVHCWSVGMGAFGGFVVNLTMSSFKVKDEESILRPQPTVVHSALAKGHWKNKWVHVSSFELHKLQVVSACWILH